MVALVIAVPLLEPASINVPSSASGSLLILEVPPQRSRAFWRFPHGHPSLRAQEAGGSQGALQHFLDFWEEYCLYLRVNGVVVLPVSDKLASLRDWEVTYVAQLLCFVVCMAL
jgi:hypothetical protein